MDEGSYINFEEGRKFLANDHLQFLHRFYEIDLNASVNSIKSSYAKKDWIELKRAAHSLKGTSSYIGALTCRKLSEDLQLACSETPCLEEKIGNYTKALLNHLESLQKYLDKYFNPVEINPSNFDFKPEPSQNNEENKEELPSFTIKKLVPPVSRVTVIESSHTYGEDEIDAYDEINKQWRCEIV